LAAAVQKKEPIVATNMATPTTFAASAEFSMPTGITAAPVTPDRRRVWLWVFLAVVVASQLYFVRELVAAFALFAIAFAAIAAVVACFYLFVKSWELAVARLASLRQPVMRLASVTNMASVGRENQKAA
jgi:hypothetical protein